MAGTILRPRVAVALEQCWHRVPGGTARAALDLVEALRITGEVELIGVSARHRRAPRPPWDPTIPVAALGLPRLVLYDAWHRLRRGHVECATGPVDVIHATGLAIPPRTVPIVVTLHDLAFLRSPEYFTRHGLRFFNDALRLIRRDGDIVMCSSDATRRDACEAGIPAERLRVVPLGVKVPEVRPESVEALRHRVGLKGRYVMHLGTDEPRKNRGALIRIADRLPGDVTVVLAGGKGWGQTVPSDGARVLDLGFVSEADKHALLAGASVLCFPSFWEGFGLPVLEAMAHGTPVVTSAGTAMAELTADAAVLVDPHDDDAIVAALQDVLGVPEVAQRLSTGGRARAGGFSWERCAGATLDAYREATQS